MAIILPSECRKKQIIDDEKIALLFDSLQDEGRLRRDFSTIRSWF